MIKVIDNLLPPMYANQIEHDTVHELMYKYRKYTSSVPSMLTNTDNIIDYGQFVCTLLNSSVNAEYKFGNYFNFLKAVIFTANQHIDKQIVSIERVKVNLLLQQCNFSKNHYNFPHVDESEDTTQYSMIYYINDSDGDTFMFNEFYNPDQDPPTELTLYQRVSPKKNRAVIFNSNRYHASSNPKEHANRFIINFVMKVE